MLWQSYDVSLLRKQWTYTYVCAFSNTYNGFIVLGIEDMKNKLGEDRIVGLDRTDLAVEFGQKKDIDPAV